jgi:hypothetical protein
MKVAAVIAFIAMCGAVVAEETAIYGFSASCGTWSKERGAHSRAAVEYGDWLLGYLSGFASSGIYPVDVLKASDPEGAVAWVDGYCRSHPLDRLADAARAAMFAIANRAEELRGDSKSN